MTALTAIGAAVSVAPQIPIGAIAPEPGRWLFGLFAGSFSLIALPITIYLAVRSRNWAPFLMWVGGLITSFNEGMLDHLEHLWWPLNLAGPAYQTFGISVPFLAPMTYPFFIGIASYAVYRIMEKGLTQRAVLLSWVGLTGLEVLLEVPGTASGAYIYYGDPPLMLGGYPLWVAWTCGCCYLVIAFLTWLFSPILKGWGKLCLIFIPVIGFLGTTAATAWPVYIALNYDQAFAIPPAGQWLLQALSLGISAMIAVGIGKLVATDSLERLRK